MTTSVARPVEKQRPSGKKGVQTSAKRTSKRIPKPNQGVQGVQKIVPVCRGPKADGTNSEVSSGKFGSNSQWERALMAANAVRHEAVVLREFITTHNPRPNEVIARCQLNISVRRVLLAYPSIGETRVRHLCKAANVSPDLLFGGRCPERMLITPAGRERLIAAVMPTWVRLRASRQSTNSHSMIDGFRAAILLGEFDVRLESGSYVVRSDGGHGYGRTLADALVNASENPVMLIEGAA